MANNIEGSNAKNTQNSIDKGNGNFLSNMANNLLFSRTMGNRGSNQGSNESGGSATGGGRLKPKDLDAMGKYNTGVADIHERIIKAEGKQGRKAVKTQGKQTRETEAARAAQVDASVANAAKSGSLSKVNIDKTAGQYGYEFHPQAKGQQQANVKPLNNTKTAVDRTPLIVQGPARKPKTPSAAGINRQNAAADSYNTPSVKGSPMTPGQRSQNRAARSYTTPPNA